MTDTGSAAAQKPPGGAAQNGQAATVVCHLGPTNSGKTHQTLAALADRGRGVYAAPLRMLAAEAFEFLAASVGRARVGLVTGEEQHQPDAPLLCVTAELAPLAGDTLVLDEVHWAADPERGSAWARLLAFSRYQHLRLVGAPDAAPLLQGAVPDAEVRLHHRRSPLVWGGLTTLPELPASSLVVAFSRAAVIMLARDLGELRPGKVALLYGAMPPATRREQVRRFARGQAEVLVATDVVGHGINLPCRHVVFAETGKFDGQRRRTLSGWEVGQIAGRAGRGGQAEPGRVWALAGVGLHADPRLLEGSLQPPLAIRTTGGVTHGYRRLRRSRLRPQLGELGCRAAAELPAALRAWRQAWTPPAGVDWLEPEQPGPLTDRLAVVLAAEADLSLEQAWTLAHAPVDLPADAPLLARLARCLRGRASLADLVDPAVIGRGLLPDAETAARQAGLLRWYTLRFPGVGRVSYEQAVRAERAAARRVSQLLPAAVARSAFGRCLDCQQRCRPWQRRCDGCHQAWWEEGW
jgi:ATP-dependent RNA helicase SUPV3L1/SUV3